MRDLAIIVPVLNRPHLVAPLVDNIAAATPSAHRVMFVCDPDDQFTRDEIARTTAGAICPGGNYAAKINTGIRNTTEPLVFLAADDLLFHDGWLDKALAHLTGPVQVVGVNDLCSQRVRDGQHATHFLMSREYALQPTIDGGRGPLCERYDHSYVDDELVGTATQRGALAFATDSIVEHIHWASGKAPWDATYIKGRALMREDHIIFQGRRALWA